MYISAKGIKLWVEVSGGTTTPVLLLHGFPDTHDLWRRQIEFLSAAGHRVIAPDLPGFGRSDKPQELDTYKLENLAEVVCCMLDELNITEKVILVGHDGGSCLAWTLAFMQPHRLERLVAMSVGFPGSLFSADPAQRAKSWYFLFYWNPEAEDYMAADDWALARQMLEDNCNAEQQQAYIDYLSQPGTLTAGLAWYRGNKDLGWFAATKPQLPPAPLDIPVLGIWSENDAYLVEAGMTVSEAVVTPGKWSYHKVEGAGHWMMRDKPGQVNSLLADFIGIKAPQAAAG